MSADYHAAGKTQGCPPPGHLLPKPLQGASFQAGLLPGASSLSSRAMGGQSGVALLVALVLLSMAFGLTACSGGAKPSALQSVSGYEYEEDAGTYLFEGVGGYRAFTVSDDARLKFVGSSGVAQRFDDDSFGSNGAVLYLNPGSAVLASIGTRDFQIPGKEYRILNRRYLDALRSDLEGFKLGHRSFDSALSALSPQDDYLLFIEALSTIGTADDANTVACLILDSSACT